MTKIYLISPPKIDLAEFSKSLEAALKTRLVPVFQLRLKDYSEEEVKTIALELQKICKANNCLFIVNDSYELAVAIGADGVHLGADDGSIQIVKEKSLKDFAGKDFVIGASCYDSKHLAMEAGEQGADYISFGAFFPSKTKVSRGNPTLETVEWCNELIELPIVVIGGITDENCAPLVQAGADFLAVISHVWDNPEGVERAICNLDEAIISNTPDPITN